jgi:glycosyltransferase involved in cell wall biosynthesis
MSEKKKPKIAFVVQRYGADVSGGAENHCRQIVEKMSDFWEIEVLTSCAKDYLERFENDYSPGKTRINGILVRRFEIDYFRSDDSTFAKLDTKVLNRQSSRDEDLLWLKEIGPYSSSLLSYVEGNGHKYEMFVFFGYLYATTTLILPMVRERACLVPTSHDEPPIYSQFYDGFFNLPKLLIINTQEELAFLRKRTSGQLSPAIEVGVGIEVPDGVVPDLFRQRYQIYGDFILYVGRIQKQKGCDELFTFYLALPPEVRRSHPLVLIGKRAMEIPEDESIIQVGFVSDEIKYSAMSAAKLLIMPSRFESLNMVILESWLCETPALVNGHCDVLREHCRKSNGGLWYTDFDEFEQCVRLMISDRNLSAGLALNGKRYTEDRYNWKKIKRLYLEIFEDLIDDKGLGRPFSGGDS